VVRDSPVNPLGQTGDREFVRDALRTLGIRRFVLGVHVSAFPPSAWDAGYGTPLSPAGQRLLAFAARLGFNALQLGPSGQISPVNVSPYDGTAFARSTWSLELAALATDEFANLLPRDAIERLELGPGGGTRIEPQRVQRTIHAALDACRARLAQLRATHPQHPLLRDFERFRLEQSSWLELNAAYEVLSERVGDDPSRFSSEDRALFEASAAGRHRRAALRAACGPAIERSELAQYLCHRQHARFRELAREHGLALWGDLHVGFSHRDRLLYASCFTPRWLLGAPPSRTNPDGQPWGHPVLDPDQLDDAGSPARQLLDLRLRKLLSEYDGIRIDHPHGLVCPWIYRANDPDPHVAVRQGARAFESPDSRDADLARWAIARAGDIDPTVRAPYADDRVRHLDEAQVTRYSRAFDLLATLDGGRPMRDVFAAEVLSTCPYPLQRVLARHGLGRFRVTQKADPARVDDVYRTEHARPEDWLMLGTHDTPPVFPVAAEWLRNGGAHARAVYLASRLIGDPVERDAAAAQLASSPGELLCGHLADLFVSHAENVYVFIGDLFGEHEPFNRAGIIHPDNWTPRLPDDFEAVYATRRREGRALDIAAALRIALTRRLPTASRGD
jgi:4-alpha-glucanotransferase